MAHALDKRLQALESIEEIRDERPELIVLRPLEWPGPDGRPIPFDPMEITISYPLREQLLRAEGESAEDFRARAYKRARTGLKPGHIAFLGETGANV